MTTAARAADEVIIEQQRTFGRGEFEQLGESMARLLVARGVTPHARVAWMMHNRAEVLALAGAARLIGAIVVPLTYRAAPDELARMLRVADCVLVVVEQPSRDAIAALGLPVIDVDDPQHEQALADASSIPLPDPAEVATTDRLGAGSSMLFTSGTTGSPKAAVRARGDAMLANAIADGFGFDADTRYITSGPLYHSGPWTCALMALSRGGVVGIPARFEPHGWIAFARRHRLNASFITPTQLRGVVAAVEAGAVAPPDLRAVVVSGEPFPPELKERAVAALGPCLVECYGCTELGPITYVPSGELLARATSSGRAFPGVHVAAFSGGQRLPPGEVGVIHAKTPLAFEGYVDGTGGGQPTRGETGTPRGWATAGDLGMVDIDGYLHLMGRGDDMIITGGVNVHPADVEAVVLRHPLVSACAAYGVPDETWGQVVCVAVVGDRELTLDGLRGWLLGRLADDKRPRSLVHVSELPMTGTGKVSRRLVRDTADAILASD